MRLLRALLIYIAVVFVAGGLLAPWLYWLAAWAASAGLPVGRIPQAPFYLFVSRAMLIVALIGLWPIARIAELKSWRDLGFSGGGSASRDLGTGLVVGFVGLLIAASLILSVGARALGGPRSGLDITRHLANALLAAVVVSFLEETLFRGVLLGILQRGISRGSALLLSSGFYAIVHFFQRPPQPAEVEWSTGLTAVASMARGFVDVSALVPGFLNLALAGLVLGVAFQRTGTLWMAMGVHAAWIFWTKSFSFFTEDVPGANVWFWGSRKLVDGWVACGILVALLTWVVKRVPVRAVCASVNPPAGGQG